MNVEFILYVADQSRSARFYATLLGFAPTLDVPGMTEFELSDTCKLGLMPEGSIARIVSGPLPHPSWRNNHWLKQNPWFESDLLPAMRRDIRRALNRK